MNKIIVVLLFICSHFVFAQKIENLQTFKEVAAFLEKEVNKNYTFDSVFEGESELDKEDFKEVIQKIDLDNNGTIDLVVDYIGDLIVVLNKDNNKYQELKDIKYDMNLLSVLKIQEKTFFIRKIELPKYYIDYSDDVVIVDDMGKEKEQTSKGKNIITEKGIRYKVDTLEVKFGSFVEFNKNAQKATNKIKKIHFEATSCYGSCPAFELKLTSTGIFDYFGKKNTNYKGQKKGKLAFKEVEELFGLIEYVNVKNLKNRYYVNATDNPSGILKVFFENGDAKEIYDYGRSGTYNLEVIYDKLMKISDNIK